MSENKFKGLSKLFSVVQQLRDPESGCPWDLKQTHQSLRPYILEEAYEVVEAINLDKPECLKEELGDLLLQIVLHTQLATEEGVFTMDEVAEGISEKLIRRHPHVFGDIKVNNAEEVLKNWDKIKASEKGELQGSVMDNISKGMPALSRALKVSKKAVNEGFEWPDFESLWACVMSEHDEFLNALENMASFEKLEDELGDILFATVNLARFKKIDPEVALHKATDKFISRYRMMEELSDKPLREQSFETLDSLWNRAKQILHTQ